MSEELRNGPLKGVQVEVTARGNVEIPVSGAFRRRKALKAVPADVLKRQLAKEIGSILERTKKAASKRIQGALDASKLERTTVGPWRAAVIEKETSYIDADMLAALGVDEEIIEASRIPVKTELSKEALVVARCEHRRDQDGDDHGEAAEIPGRPRGQGRAGEGRERGCGVSSVRRWRRSPSWDSATAMRMCCSALCGLHGGPYGLAARYPLHPCSGWRGRSRPTLIIRP